MSLPATDTFTVAEDTNLGVYANWDENNPGGSSPLIAASTDNVQGMQGDYHGGHWVSDSFNNDQYSQARWVGTSGMGGVVVRAASSGATFYVFVAGQTGWGSDLSKSIAGADTGLDTGSDGVLNSIYKLQVSGETLTCYKDGSLISGLGATDSDITSGYAGIGFWGSGTVDDWEGGNLSTNYTISKSNGVTLGESITVVKVDGDYQASKSDTIAVAESFGLLDILNVSNQR